MSSSRAVIVLATLMTLAGLAAIALVVSDARDAAHDLRHHNDAVEAAHALERAAWRYEREQLVGAHNATLTFERAAWQRERESLSRERAAWRQERERLSGEREALLGTQSSALALLNATVEALHSVPADSKAMLPASAAPALTPRPTRMCIMMPTLSFPAFDCRLDNIGQYMVLNVSLASLLKTTEPEIDYVMLVAYSFEDRCYAQPDLLAAFTRTAQAMLVGHPNVHLLLKPMYATKCGTTILWNTIADWGYNIGCDYFVPGNDDVMWITKGWAGLAVAALRATTTPCRNFGVVAFRDKNFDGQPTFHVVSRLHLHIHNRAYYPISLVGLGVDPWIYHSYRNVGYGSMPDIFIQNFISSIGWDGVAVHRKDAAGDQMVPRYTLGDNNYNIWIDKEVPFLQQFIARTDSKKCCDSFECSPPQVGSPLGVPIGSVEHYS